MLRLRAAAILAIEVQQHRGHRLQGDRIPERSCIEDADLKLCQQWEHLLTIGFGAADQDVASDGVLEVCEVGVADVVQSRHRARLTENLLRLGAAD